MYTRKSRGSSTLPCGTPDVTLVEEVCDPFQCLTSDTVMMDFVERLLIIQQYHNDLRTICDLVSNPLARLSSVQMFHRIDVSKNHAEH